MSRIILILFCFYISSVKSFSQNADLSSQLDKFIAKSNIQSVSKDSLMLFVRDIDLLEKESLSEIEKKEILKDIKDEFQREIKKETLLKKLIAINFKKTELICSNIKLISTSSFKKSFNLNQNLDIYTDEAILCKFYHPEIYPYGALSLIFDANLKLNYIYANGYFLKSSLFGFIEEYERKRERQIKIKPTDFYTLKGTVIDFESGEPLIGASILITESTSGTISDVNGQFSITSQNAADCQIEIDYLGYQTIVLDIPGCSGDIGKVSLIQGFAGLEEVVITGVMDIVQDRRTPVAVSTITLPEIQTRNGNLEFPELMKNTPSIFVVGQARGFGASEVSTRGFDQSNTAFLLNGQPINDMESGRINWSNLTGLSDVATAVQVQRGLGSSKLAIPFIGGATNIILKATEQDKSGSAEFIYGNDKYAKSTVSYNTGLINDKFGISLLASHWQGDGWADGTKGKGQIYYISAGYQFNAKNTLNFMFTGAPQSNDLNLTKKISEHYNSNGEFNIKYNNNWGTYEDGTYMTLRKNYYHKPIANLSWDYEINDISSFSAMFYASWGRGGITGGRGYFDNLRFSDGQIDWSATEFANRNDIIDSNGFVIMSSVANNSSYGGILNYDYTLNENLQLSIGADYRNYQGTHFRQLINLLGNTRFDQASTARFPSGRSVTSTFDSDPWKALTNFAELEERIHYANDLVINSGGITGQMEYSDEDLSAFLQGSISNQSFLRKELIDELPENENSTKITKAGFNIRTGIRYDLNSKNTVYVNTGYYSRQPFFDNIFLNFTNSVNPDVKNEKIYRMEGGYNLQLEDFTANLNVYRTSWGNRTITNNLVPGTVLSNGVILLDEGFRNSMQNQIHYGAEMDFRYRINDQFKLRGYTSMGNWSYDGTLDVKYFNQNRELAEEISIEDASGLKIGGAAQTTFGVGIEYQLPMGLKFYSDYNYYDGLYTNLNAMNTSLKLPSFGIFDFGASYIFNVGHNLLKIRTNIFNLLGTEYISAGNDGIQASSNEEENWNGVNRENQVIFGKTRTWNVALKFSF